MRYEYVSPYSEANGRLVNLDVASGFTAVAPVQPGQVGPYSGGFPSGLVKPDRNNFAPRVGIAWKPFGKTVLRSGYGINYNTGQYGSMVQQLAFQPPFAFTETNVFSNACPLTLANGFPSCGSALTNNYALDKNYRLGYVQVWNLDIQRDMGKGFLLNVGYSGSKGTHLDMVEAPNRAPDGGLLIAGVQPFLFETSLGDSIYHGGTLRVRKRMQHGISVGGTYIYSKSIDNASSIGGGAVVVAQNAQDIAAERGLSSFDQRHRFTADYVYELPFGSGKALLNSGKWPSKVLAGLQWSGNITIGSGTPYTARILESLNDVTQGTNGSTRANVTGAPVTLSNPTVDRKSVV